MLGEKVSYIAEPAQKHSAPQIFVALVSFSKLVKFPFAFLFVAVVDAFISLKLCELFSGTTLTYTVF